jgi:putative transposase
MKHLTKLKKMPKYEYWNLLGSQATQDIAQRINKAYKLFFRNRQHGIKSAPPTFKKIKKYTSFTLKQAGYKLLPGNKILIAGQVYKYAKSREIEGKIKTVTIKRDKLGDLYIYFVCENSSENTVLPRTGDSVGFDFGLKIFLKGSDGNDKVCPEYFKKALKAIRNANRSVSRKKKGSRNRRKAVINLARVHKKVANQRKDYQFKLAKELAEAYSVICLEDLNIKAMKKLWGKKISDLAFSEFVNILKYECFKTGTVLIEIPRFYPSSKTCSECGFVLKDLDLKTRRWACPECGIHDRDLNAAINIHRVGLELLEQEAV